MFGFGALNASRRSVCYLCLWPFMNEGERPGAGYVFSPGPQTVPATPNTYSSETAFSFEIGVLRPHRLLDAHKSFIR